MENDKVAPSDHRFVLDHGYVRLVEAWGSEEGIIAAARQSTDGAFRGWDADQRCAGCGIVRAEFAKRMNAGENSLAPWACDSGPDGQHSFPPGDEKLLRYLYNNKHMTPFEMAGATFEIQAPIFVFREWHRHRTQSYNEMSARYTPLPDRNYVPSVERLMMTASSNKQAQGTGAALTEATAVAYRMRLEQSYSSAERLYQDALAEGVPKELARVHLPVGRYSRMWASAKLRNWLEFLTLRADTRAQWEIQQYAFAVWGLLADRFPRTLALFDEGRPPEAWNIAIVAPQKVTDGGA